MDTEEVVLPTTVTEAPWERTRVVNAPAADVVIAGGGQRLFDDGLPASKWTLTHQQTGELGEIAVVYDRAR